MLVLSRKVNEEIKIGDNIIIKVLRTSRGQMVIGIDAPREINIVRGELEKKEKNHMAYKLYKELTDKKNVKIN